MDVLGLRKPTQEEIYLERDERMRSEYFDPIERFPERMDQLLDVINRVCPTLDVISLYVRFFSFI